jgi:hypothetical protein
MSVDHEPEARPDAEADALEAAAIDPAPPPGDRPSLFYASPIGLIVAIVVVLLAMLVFAPGQIFHFRHDGEPGFGRDQMAEQRLADIRAEQELADARADPWREPGVVDARVSTFHSVRPVN